MKNKAIDFADLKPFLVNYLQDEHGITELRKNFACPVCGNGHKTPCCSYYGDTHHIHCFSCGYSGDVINLVSHDKSMTPREAAEYIVNRYGVGEPLKPTLKKEPVKEVHAPLVDYRTYIDRCNQSEKAMAFFQSRGLSARTIKRFHLGYDEERKLAIIPYSYFFYIGRKDYPAANRYHIEAGSRKPFPFNQHALLKSSKKPLFVVEGEINAMSLEEIGFPAVGIGSGTGWRLFNSFVTEHKTMRPVIIMLDNDEAGTAAQQELIKGLPEYIKYYSAVFPFADKDINDVLQENRAELEKEMALIYEKAEAEFLNTPQNRIEASSAIFALDSFLNKVKGNAFKPIETGYKKLDKALGGGFYNGLVIVSAAPSEGKSTISMQIVENIAEQSGRDVLIFSYEMSKEQLLARTLSRLTYECSGKNKDYSMTALEILQGDKWEALGADKLKCFNPATERYRENIAPHIYIFDDCEPTKEAILERIAEYSNLEKEKAAPIILIDYLQLLDTGSKDFVTGCKDITLALKQYAIKNETLVIAISSVNRESQKTGTSLTSGYGSSFTEYSSDYVLTLDFTAIKKKQDISKEELKQAEIRDMSITIQKNRMGATGETIEMYYAAAYNHFEEKTLEQAIADDVKTASSKRKV